MELTEEQYRRILELLPKQRGNVKNLTALNALVYQGTLYAHRALTKRKTGDREVVRRLEHKDTRNNGRRCGICEVQPVYGERLRRERGAVAAGKHRETRRHYAAYGQNIFEDNKTREFAKELGFAPVVPPKRSRKEPWDCDRELYKECNSVDRFFRRLKAFRRMCARYDKLDAMFSAFVYLAIINMTLRRENTP